MIKNAFTSFSPAIKHITKDKINFLFTLIPIFLGMLLYYFAGSWVYETVMGQGKILIDQYISEGTLGSIVYFLVVSILTIMLYFIVNWTFVLVVAFLASPFNDLLSSRIEKKLKGEKNLNLQESVVSMGRRLLGTLANEAKKISFILFLSVISMLFGYFPLLAPVGVFIAIILLAIEFIDYSWARNKLSFANCVGDLRRNIFGYALGGAFFFILVSIPLINLIVPSLATSYFTDLWMKNNEYRTKITK